MRYQDVRNANRSSQAQHARQVYALLPLGEWVLDGANVDHGTGAVLFDVSTGRIVWQDDDGEARTLDVPARVTAGSVAAILSGLGSRAPRRSVSGGCTTHKNVR